MSKISENNHTLAHTGAPVADLLQQADFLAWHKTNILDIPNSHTKYSLALIELNASAKQLREIEPSIHRVTTGIFRTILPNNSIFGLWRGVQIVAIVPHEANFGPAAKMQQALRTLAEFSFYLEDGASFVASFSAAVADFQSNTALVDIINDAEGMLAIAKNTGGGCVLAHNAETGPPQEKVRHILLAEDDMTTATLAKHRLKKENYKVTHCMNGIEAIEQAQQGDFCLFLLDINMPEMDGFEVLGRLRNMPQYRNTPIIIMTAIAGDDVLVQAFEQGADDFLAKPCSPLELAARVKRLLARRLCL